ncbi:MAG: hypothetical protein RL087_1044, partial [Pseudomonadota bacterium]
MEFPTEPGFSDGLSKKRAIVKNVDSIPAARPSRAGPGHAASGERLSGMPARPEGSFTPSIPDGRGDRGRFQAELGRAKEDLRGAEKVLVERGDTLSSLVRQQWVAQGGRREELSAGQTHRWALQMARANGLADPDRIAPGQRLALVAAPQNKEPAPARVAGPAAAADASATPATGSSTRPAPAVAVPRLPEVAPLALSTGLSNLDNRVMNQTLDRAVDLGFIPVMERQQVGARIAELADKHGFQPDDFARAVLMESDGLNPRASNGQCHGIIQFCSGPDRGAASAGYGRRPQEILKLSVLRQLDLVDRYFDDTRLKDFRGADGRVRLDDLYLTILTPAARQERRLSAPLPIAGPQAMDLHVRRDRAAPITRSSILSGLYANARQ